MWAGVSGPAGISGTVQRDEEPGAIGTPSPSGHGAGCSGGREQRGRGEADLGFSSPIGACGAAEVKYLTEDLSCGAAGSVGAGAKASCPPAPPDKAPLTPRCSVSSAALLPMQCTFSLVWSQFFIQQSKVKVGPLLDSIKGEH